MHFRLAIAAAIAAIAGAFLGARAATTVTVDQRGLVFTKSSVVIGRGDRIVFTNQDDVIHNIHVFGPGEEDKDVGLQKPGATLSYTFDKSGAYTVRCNIHPSVKMSVTVK